LSASAFEAPADASVRSCPIGCRETGVAIGSLATTMAIPLSRSDYTLTRCGCGQLLYLSPAPTAADLQAMYVDQNQFGDEYTDPDRANRIIGYMTHSLDQIAAVRAWPVERPLRVLEVGAGLSWMCNAAKRRNPACTTVAQDISPEAAARCPWVDAYVQGDIDDARLDAHAPYDVISMTHVIEHLVEPVATVRRCLARLAPDGVVFVTAPFRPLGWRDDAPDLDKWRAYSYNHVPAHIQYFSEGSMRRLADAVGGTLVHWSHRHDGGQAFEAWIATEAPSKRPRDPSSLARVIRRVAGALRLLAAPAMPRLRCERSRSGAADADKGSGAGVPVYAISPAQYVSMCSRLLASNCGFSVSQSSPCARHTSRNASTTPASMPFRPQM
jgi:SAM-dependent methyltransferase